MAQANQSSMSEGDLARLLPTCQRCRRLRRKCDTQLPACRLCQKGKADCTFFDHALQQQLPRSYVHSLLTRLDRLKSVQDTITGNRSSQQSPVSPTFQRIPPVVIQTPGSSPRPGDFSFDKHFVVSNANPTCWQFFGSSSLLALAVEVLVHARTKFGPVTHQDDYTRPEYWLNRQVEENSPGNRDAPDRSVIEKLVALYLAAPNTLRAFVDEDTIMHDIEGYLASHGSDARRLVSYQAHQFFRISMICAIACANKARHRPSYAAESMRYYSEALRCVEEVTSEVSVESLVALLLLILFSMFYPRKGDIWKLLDFACRLSVELGYHTEEDTAFADEKSRIKRRQIFWGLYCIERSIGQHFGRPSDLPEEIITTEYPASLNSASMADAKSFQSIAMSHYYRLVYLRSEISREIYLPTNPPSLPSFWYQQKFLTISAWRQELPPYENLTGVGTVTCDIAYEASILFLFQPLVLRALANTRDSNYSSEALESLPSESFWSACQIIEIYKKIVRAPEDSYLGMYPLTIVSAMHIQTAAMTILAFCLLAIDGRIPIKSWNPETTEEATKPISFSNIYETSGSCLVLLTKCAEKWQGMVGILDIYQNLSDKILPIIMRSGLG